MKKLLVVLPLLAVVALATPRTADAYFSLSIGLPGFGIFVPAPVPPPVVYGPPVAYAPPPVYAAPPVVYYRPAPVFYPAYYGHGHGHHYGWYRHGR